MFGLQFKKLVGAFDFALAQKTALLQKVYESNTNVVLIQRQAALVSYTPDASQTLLYAQEREERRQQRKKNKAEARAKGTHVPKADKADAKGQASQRLQQQDHGRGGGGDGQGRGCGRRRGSRGRGGGFYEIQTTNAEPPPLNLKYHAGAEDPVHAQDDNAREAVALSAKALGPEGTHKRRHTMTEPP